MKTLYRHIILGAFAALPLAGFAQAPGTMISGTVSDDIEPLMMVNVVEVDEANRIVAHGVTDINGNFSFRIVDPKHRLKISYVGYATQIIPIKGTRYNIILKSNLQLKEVVVQQKRVVQSSGLAIPEREVSMAHQTIDAKEFEGLSLTSIDEALQGRVAGLDIVFNSGDLGSGTTMRLRGVSSINGNTQPLVVVDGNIFESDYLSGFDFASATEEQYSELLNVNPDDIASITVLKDAAGTAIYGSQGANGVIEIKTKRGARGKTRVTYSYGATMTYQPKGMRMLNGDQYTMLMKEAYYNPQLSDAASDIPEFNYDPSFAEYENYNNNTDWVDAVRKTGWLQKHYVTISGGGEKAVFRISGGYDHQTGTVIGQELNRFTTRVALDYFVSDRIKIVTNFNMTYQDNQKNYSDLLGIAYKKMPNMSIYEQDAYGNDTQYYYHMLQSASQTFKNDGDQLSLVNPVALAYEATSDESKYTIQPEFQLHYNLLGLDATKTQLKYEGKVLFNISNTYNDTFYPSSLVTSGWSNENNNKATSAAHKSNSITTTHRLTFTPAFKNSDHSFMAMAQFQLVNGNSKSQDNTVTRLPTGNIQSATADGLITEMSTGAGQWRSIYLTFSAHYAYKGRYIADFSVRRDGSTKFGDSRRWGNFPAFSLRWNIVDEPWMKWSEKWLSMLSVRPGWGRVGNPPGSDYLYFSKYTNTDNYDGNGSVYPSNIRLSNLQWEEKETWNVGFDLGLFDNKITADFNIYTQLTSKLLMTSVNLPSSSGFSKLDWTNAGDMRNNGWEFNINGTDVVKAGKFSLDFNVTFANNKNEITKMDPTILANLNGDFNNSNGSYLSRVQLNNPYGSIYGFRYKGVYQYDTYQPDQPNATAPVVRDEAGNVVLDGSGDPIPMYFAYGTTSEYRFRGGDAIYEDINHDGSIDELDIVYLGNSNPKFDGGFGTTVRWKRLSLNVFFNYRVGGKIINFGRMNAENMYNTDNQSVSTNWRWRKDGDLTEIPRALYQSGYNWLGSDRFVEDGSFLRLKQVTLNYSFDPKLLKKAHLNNLSLSLTLNNMLTFTKYTGADPEISPNNIGVSEDNNRTPRSRYFTFGLTIGI